jgi:hypothetical protein
MTVNSTSTICKKLKRGKIISRQTTKRVRVEKNYDSANE